MRLQLYLSDPGTRLTDAEQAIGRGEHAAAFDLSSYQFWR